MSYFQKWVHGRDRMASYSPGFTTKDIVSMGIIGTSLQHNGCVNTAKWSSDGNKIITGSDDRTIKIWDSSGSLESFPLLSEIRTPHRSNIFDVAFDRIDPSTIYSCAADGALCKSNALSRQGGHVIMHLSDHMMHMLQQSLFDPNIIYTAEGCGDIGRVDIRARNGQSMYKNYGSHAPELAPAVRGVKALLQAPSLGEYALIYGGVGLNICQLDIRMVSSDCTTPFSGVVRTWGPQYLSERFGCLDAKYPHCHKWVPYKRNRENDGQRPLLTSAIFSEAYSRLRHVSTWHDLPSVSGLQLSADGRTMLASYQSDQIYTFDLFSRSEKELVEKYGTGRNMTHKDGVGATAMFGGHKNADTFLKTVSFFGPRDEYVVAGTDSGLVWVWDTKSGTLCVGDGTDDEVKPKTWVNCWSATTMNNATTCQVVHTLQTDSRTCNGVIPHPFAPMLVAFGIDKAAKVLGLNSHSKQRLNLRACSDGTYDDDEDDDDDDDADDDDDDVDDVFEVEDDEGDHVVGASDAVPTSQQAPPPSEESEKLTVPAATLMTELENELGISLYDGFHDISDFSVIQHNGVAYPPTAIVDVKREKLKKHIGVRQNMNASQAWNHVVIRMSSIIFETVIELRKSKILDGSSVDPAVVGQCTYTLRRHSEDVNSNRTDRIRAHPLAFHHQLCRKFPCSVPNTKSPDTDIYLRMDEGPSFPSDACFSMSQFGLDIELAFVQLTNIWYEQSSLKSSGNIVYQIHAKFAAFEDLMLKLIGEEREPAQPLELSEDDSLPPVNMLDPDNRDLFVAIAVRLLKLRSQYPCEASPYLSVEELRPLIMAEIYRLGVLAKNNGNIALKNKHPDIAMSFYAKAQNYAVFVGDFSNQLGELNWGRIGGELDRSMIGSALGLVKDERYRYELGGSYCHNDERAIGDGYVSTEHDGSHWCWVDWPRDEEDEEDGEVNIVDSEENAALACETKTGDEALESRSVNATIVNETRIAAAIDTSQNECRVAHMISDESTSARSQLKSLENEVPITVDKDESQSKAENDPAVQIDYSVLPRCNPKRLKQWILGCDIEKRPLEFIRVLDFSQDFLCVFLRRIPQEIEELGYNLRVTVLNNVLSILIANERYSKALSHCLEMEKLVKKFTSMYPHFQPLDAKFHFRRGTAKSALGNYEEALEDMQEAHRLAPADAGITKKMKEIKGLLDNKRKQASKRMSKFFS